MTAALLFDLDGTLTDPREGITRCIRHAFAAVGEPCPSDDVLLQWIGPPLQRSFSDHLGEEAAHLVPSAIAAYRERFASLGMYENAVYPGIREALVTLRDVGWRLYVATSKPTVFASTILRHFELFDFFEKVYGSELSGERSDKGALIAHLLSSESMAPGHATMIGDRALDVWGARQNSVRAIGVLWGYGSLSELEGAGAHHILTRVPELVAITSKIGDPLKQRNRDLPLLS